MVGSSANQQARLGCPDHYSNMNSGHTPPMDSIFLRSRPRGAALRAALVACLAVMAPVTSTLAQTEDCEGLRQQLQQAGRGDSGRAMQFQRAAQRQRSELARTQSYADQIGCGRSFSIFGSDTPPQCDALEGQIERMTNNLHSLEGQATAMAGDDEARQGALAQRYQAYCAVSPSQSDGSGTDPGAIGDGMRPGLDDTDPNAEQPEDGQRRGGKAVCVRTCDGGFFPLNYSGAQRDSASLQNLCSALCPNTEAKLYTVPDLDKIGDAVSTTGAPYTDLKAAFKFQKSFDPTCTCKPPNKSWVEALADAERLLDKDTGDVTVTSRMSDDMARPTSAAQQPGKRKPNKADRKAALDKQAAAESVLGAVGAQAPTASRDSAGIVTAVETGSRTMKTGEGDVRTLPGPSGTNRRVRIIEP